MCDITVIALTDSMEQIEDYHMIYVHSLSDTIQKALKEKYAIKANAKVRILNIQFAF